MGTSAAMSKSCWTISRRATPVRSSPNSRLARSGTRNCSIVEYASAINPPAAKTSGTSDRAVARCGSCEIGLAVAGPAACHANSGGAFAPSCAGSAATSLGMITMPMSWGVHVSRSAVFHGRLDGNAPIATTPPSMPIIAESS